jgi:putative ABC transport system permease protein
MAMKWLNRARFRLSRLARRRQLDRDLEDELRFHLEMLGTDHDGAQRQFGNYTRLKEACRDMWTLGSIEIWLQDVRYSLRMLRRSPGFTAVAVVALALGIGVNTTVFSLANGALYKNLPFADSDRILYLLSTDRTNGLLDEISYPDFKDLQNQMKSFDGMAATRQNSADLSDGVALPQNYQCAEITANSFSVIGQKPAAGRDFTSDDELPGATRVALIAYSLWENRYGKDAAVIGRTIRVNALPTVVIGVMPRGLTFPRDTEVWLPLAAHKGEDRGDRYITVFGHLASGASIGRVRAESDAISSHLAQQFPETNRNRAFVVQRYNEMALGDRVRLVFWMMLAAVGFVLLIACANVANLTLARAIGRSREVSIRVALGASRLRVMRQLLMESLLLSMVAGAMGWFVPCPVGHTHLRPGGYSHRQARMG